MKKCLIISSDSDNDSETDNNEMDSPILNEKIYKISELNYKIQNIIKNNIYKINIIGEVTNLSFRTHLYFSLKDNDSKIDCFLWESIYNRIGIEINNGDKIVCKGIFNLYHKLGKLQLTVETFYIDGQGELQKKFLQRKKYFESLGYFREDIKKSINKYNHNIGIVTSVDSAAYQDVLSVINRKNPYVNLYVSDCRVQGIKCERNICDSLKKMDKLSLDLIILTRGGGSLEDLWGFNEEELIETIYNCQTPIISAVGHQIDHTLSDYVSDVCAITPSIGADIAVSDIKDIIKSIEDIYFNIQNKIKSILIDLEQKMIIKIKEFEKLEPSKEIERIQDKINSIFDKITIKYKNKSDLYLSKINEGKEKLELVNPLNILKNGYSIIRNGENKSIKSIKELKELDSIKIVLSDGEINIKL